MTLQEFMAANGLRQKFDEDGFPVGWVSEITGRSVDNEDFNKSGTLIETYNKLAANNFDYGNLAAQSGYSGSDPYAYFRGEENSSGQDVPFGSYTLNNIMGASNQDSQFYGADTLLKDYAFGSGGFNDSNPSASYQNFVSGQAPDRTDWIGPLLQAGMIAGVGGLAFGGIGGGELASGFTDAASGAIGAGDLGTTIGAGEFGLSGATAGNLAGTGGLSSAAGINGLGEGLGTGGLGLGSGAAGAAAQGVGSSSLLSPSLAATAGLGAAGIGASGGGSLLGGSTAAPSAAASMGGAAAAAPAITAGSALSRFIDGTATAADYTQLLGGVAGSALGVYGANQQAQSYENVANKFLDMGQPYRDRLNASYAPNFSMANQPDFMNALDLGSESVLKKLSATGGNPYGNAGAMAEANKYVSGSLALPQLNTYRSQLGTFGQLGTNQAGSAMGAQTQAQGSKYDALGYGIGQLTQPDNPFKGLLDQLKGFRPSNGGAW